MSTGAAARVQEGTAAFMKLAHNPWKLRLFLLRYLPAAYFSGVRMVSVGEDACAVRVPYRWFTRNPFRSTYFACLAMAGEMSTGLLAMAQTYRRQPSVSMLVTAMEASFYKKATGPTVFTCRDGLAIKSAVDAALATGEAQTVKAEALGYNTARELVARFVIEWSFKAKSKN